MIEKNIIDNYLALKVRLVSDSAIRLNRIVEEIKKEDEFQDEYIDEFNWELDELIYIAKNLKINREVKWNRGIKLNKIIVIIMLI